MQTEQGPVEEFEPANTITISSFDMLKIVADPTRLRIMESMMERPLTVKQVARMLNTSPTKLYYHVNLLEENGLLTVTGSRVVSGIIEKQYRTSAKNLNVDRSLLTIGGGGQEGGVDKLLSVIFDSTRASVLRGIESGLINLDQEDPAKRNSLLVYSLTKLTPEKYADFFARLKALLAEFNEGGKAIGTQSAEKTGIYGLTLVLYPLPEAEAADEESPEIGQWKID
jgi:DNA-binding transcriptional ArsR family regulator